MSDQNVCHEKGLFVASTPGGSSGSISGSSFFVKDSSRTNINGSSRVIPSALIAVELAAGFMLVVLPLLLVVLVVAEE